MRRRLLVLLTLAALTAAGCGLPGHSRSHQQIGTDAASLRAAFSASAGDTRVLALVSPTCGTCLLGATTMENDVFAKITSTRLRGFIVWVPKLGAHQNDVAGATPTVPDPRATHYWDGTGYLVHGYPAVLGLDADAWDVYSSTPRRAMDRHSSAQAQLLDAATHPRQRTRRRRTMAERTYLRPARPHHAQDRAPTRLTQFAERMRPG